MPRRSTPLSPDDGPAARFALALRQLRDEAGFDAPTVTNIAAKNHIPRSTLHAAMRGKRIPSLPVLAALVRSWSGDEGEWARRRTETEQEIERLRLQAASVQNGDDSKLRRMTPVLSLEQQKAAVAEFKRRLARESDPEWQEQLNKMQLAFEETREEAPDPARGASRSDGNELERPEHLEAAWEELKKAVGDKAARAESWCDQDASEQEQKQIERLLELRHASTPPDDGSEERHQTETELTGEIDPAALWRMRRAQAGNPTIRQLASDTGLTFQRVSEVLRGRAHEGSVVERKVLDALEAHSASLTGPDAEFLPPPIDG
jgi:transcriptional regulator with XRE-family HTH domain